MPTNREYEGGIDISKPSSYQELPAAELQSQLIKLQVDNIGEPN